MKTNPQRKRLNLTRVISSLLLGGGILGHGITAAQAANYYWDIDQAIPGAGGATPSGFWSTGGTNWSTSSSGSEVTSPYTTLATDDLFFSAGSDATGAYTISLTDAQNAASLTFEDGNATISGTGGAINLAGVDAKIIVGTGLTAIIGENTSTVIAGSVGLTKLGSGTLTLNGSAANTFTGGLNIGAGALTLDYANLATPTDLIGSANSLSLAGSSTLTIAGQNLGGATTVQSFAGATLGTGINTLNIAKGASATSVTLNLDALTVNQGGVTMINPTTLWAIGMPSTTEIIKITSFNGNALPASGKVNVSAALFYRNNVSGAPGTARWVSVDSAGQLQGLPAAVGGLTATTNAPTLAHQISTADVTLTTTTASSYGLVANPNATRILKLADNGTYTINGILGTNTNLTTISPGTGTSNLVIGPEKNLVINMDNTGGVTIAAPIANNGSTGGTGGTMSAVTIASTAPTGTTPGNVVFNGANTYSGPTFVNNGILRANNAASLGTAESGTFVAAGATLQSQATITVANEALSLNGTGTTGTNGALNVGGNNTLTWGGPITLTGNTRVHADGGSALNFTATATVNLNSFDLNFNSGNGADSTFAGSISGTGGLSKTTGTAMSLNLNGNNSYSGATTISAGILNLGNANALGNTSGVTIAAGATLRPTLNNLTVTAPITVLAGASNAVINAPTFNAGGGGVATFNVNTAISGNGGVTFNSSLNVNSLSTVQLNTASNYSGATLLDTNGGTSSQIIVKLGINDALPTTTVVTIDGQTGAGSGRFAEINLNGFNQTLAGLTNTTRNLRVQRVVNSDVSNAATLTINNTNNYTFSGNLGAGAPNGSVSAAAMPGSTNGNNFGLIKSGTGTFALTAANTYSGTTKITGGILSLGNAAAMSQSALDTLNSVAGDDTNGLRTTVTTLTLGGVTGDKNLADVFTTTTGGYTGVTALTLNPVANASYSYSGVIGDGATGMTLTKTGAGTQVLSGNNTYTGTTTVSAGKLLINGNNSAATGPVNVSALATLGGSGTIGGLTTVASTGIVAPGNSTGNLTFGAGADLSGGGVYHWELGALSTANAGTDFDLITVSGGNLALGGTSALTLDFGLVSATDPNSADAFWTSPRTWKIIDVTGGTNTGDTNLSAITNATYTSGSFTTTVGTGGDLGDIFLVFTPALVGGPSVWQGADNDPWTAAGSWNGSVPNSNTAEAKFVTTGGTTVNLDTNQTVNKLTFDATAPHTISGASTLTLAGTTPSISTAGSNTATQTVAVNLDLAAGTAIDVQGGTLELNSPANAVLGAGVTATVTSGATLSLGGTGNALSNGTSTHANVANSGTLTATTAGKRVGEISGSGTTTVTAAGATLTANHIRQSTLNIGAGNTVTVAANGGNSGTSVVTNLNINATGKLDLNDNDLVVDNGNLATLTAQLATGLDINGTYGNGPGITSTAFANNVDFNTVLGIAANVELGYTSFSGQTVDANDVLIKYTYYGDADLSGSVDTSTDFDLYITGLTSGGSLGGWLFGDFDYSGTVDSSTDFDLYITGLTSQGSPLLTAGGGGNLVQAVPEPSALVLGSLALFGLAAAGLRRRRLVQQ